MITLLAGGVGGAKLALGLAEIVSPRDCTVVVNTGDDLEWHGLHISPDVDTMLYTLAGKANPDTGWGIADDTTRVLDALAELGFDRWFHVGDQDLATHIARTEWMRKGLAYTRVVERLADAHGVQQQVLPMTDGMVRTIVHTTEGPLEFQDYFLHWQSAPKITGFTYKGIEAAKPTPDVLEALTSAKIILIGPSNPFVSIAPILALSGVRDILKGIRAPVVALTPIVGGRALKGPAARMLREMGYGVSALGVAGLYRDFLDGFVLDVVDADICREVEASGIRCLSTDTVMQTLRDRKRVAQQMVAFARRV